MGQFSLFFSLFDLMLPGKLKSLLSVAGAQQERVRCLVQEPRPSLNAACRTSQFPPFNKQSWFPSSSTASEQSKHLTSNMALSSLHATEDPDTGSAELDICTFQINIKHEVVPSLVCSFFFSLGLTYCFFGMYLSWFYCRGMCRYLFFCLCRCWAAGHFCAGAAAAGAWELPGV